MPTGGPLDHREDAAPVPGAPTREPTARGPSPSGGLADRIAAAPRRPWPGRPVPVALIITGLDVGGAERALTALATGLDRRRWEPRVYGLGPEGPLADPLRAEGIPVTCLDVDPRQPVRAVARLARALRARR